MGFCGRPHVKVYNSNTNRHIKAPKVSAGPDFTGKLPVNHLQPHTAYRCTVRCGGASRHSEFKTPPHAQDEAAVMFAWVADVAGQGSGRKGLLVTMSGDREIEGGILFAKAVADMAPNIVLLQGALHQHRSLKVVSV